MTRIRAVVRLALACASAGLLAFAFSGTVGPVAADPSADGGTALPAGWELCVLQGVGAPATTTNIVDLDEWQIAEGGSTNNTAAYNPFNTYRTTDASGAPLPQTTSANGFPAYANWLAGCAATVATLLQPNMSSIIAALRAGNISPPGAFLAAVDQSQWCAPTNGVPCYMSSILNAAASLPIATISDSSALDVYGSVTSELHAYRLSVVAVALDQDNLASKNQQLSAAESQVTTADDKYADAENALRRFAVDEYVSTGLYVGSTFLDGTANNADHRTPFGPQDAAGVLAQQYESITASGLLDRFQGATANVKTLRDRRAAAAKAYARAAVQLTTDTTDESRALARLLEAVDAIQKAGACTTVMLTSVTQGAPTAISPTAPTSTTTTTTVPPTTTTTTTTVPPTTTTTSTTTTTTTTVPSGSTTTTVPPTTTTTTTTTTVPPTTTTTTTVPPTTTTTTTTVPPPPATYAPGAATGNSGTPTPAGLLALQGCVAALAPPSSQASSTQS
jgi:hypothetical protein